MLRLQLHDMAINVLSRRMGGTKTGLINASFVRAPTSPLIAFSEYTFLEQPVSGIVWADLVVS